MKLGVNLWTVYGWTLPEPVRPDVLKGIAAMGATGVELVLDDHSNTAHALLARKAETKAAVADAGLEIPSVASALFWRHNLGAQDTNARERALRIVHDGCRVASAFGARVFLVVAGLQEPGVEYARTYDQAVGSLQQAAAFAADHGVIIGVENVGSNFLCSPGEYVRFLVDVDHPSVQAYLDPGNGAAIGHGYPENWVTAVRGRIAMVHAKDYDRREGTHVPCGQGELAWDGILTALRDVGYDDYVTVETPPLGGRERLNPASGLAAAESSVRWLKPWV